MGVGQEFPWCERNISMVHARSAVSTNSQETFSHNCYNQVPIIGSCFNLVKLVIFPR